MANKLSQWVDQLSTTKALLLGGGIAVVLVGGAYLLKTTSGPQRVSGSFAEAPAPAGVTLAGAFRGPAGSPGRSGGPAGWTMPQAGALFKVCAQCHDRADVARYTKTFGPMVTMMNPMRWSDPRTFTQGMAPMVDPETYEQWYQAWAKSIGRALKK